MSLGAGGKSKKRLIFEAIAQQAAEAEANRPRPVLQSPEKVNEDSTFRGKGRRGLRIALDDSSAAGTGLAINA